jgi:hypothetical protein
MRSWTELSNPSSAIGGITSIALPIPGVAPRQTNDFQNQTSTGARRLPDYFSIPTTCCIHKCIDTQSPDGHTQFREKASFYPFAINLFKMK